MATRREFLKQGTAAGILGAAGTPLVAAVTEAIQKEAAPIDRSAGMVQTVLGPIPADKLGYTLPHEHILASSAGFLQTWPELLGGRANFVQKVVTKLKEAKGAGVDTLVDVTPLDVGRDIRLLEEVSRLSGVNIVAATGHWLAPSLSMSARTVDELTAFFRLEIERGIEDTGIKPGVIKVATDQEGVTPFLERALRAAARASKATGVPVTTHTVAAARIGEKQADIFESERLDPAMVCLGHCDDSDDLGYLTGLAKRGYLIGMDHLTWGTRPAGGANPPPLTWQQRSESIKKLIDAGYGNQIFMSNDWYFGLSIAPTGSMEAVERMTPDGLLFSTRKVIPHLRQIGVTDGAIRTITVENPRRFFAGRGS